MPPIMKAFDKQELFDMCIELELNVTSNTQARDMVDMIIKEVRSDYQPEKYSKLLLEFLLTDNIINDAGELQEQAEEEKEEAKPAEYPKCYGFYDKIDFSCGNCALAFNCKATRKENRPDCFELLYDENSPDCSACVEAEFCRGDR